MLWPIFIVNKSNRYQGPDIKDNSQNTSYHIATMPQRRQSHLAIS